MDCDINLVSIHTNSNLDWCRTNNVLYGASPRPNPKHRSNYICYFVFLSSCITLHLFCPWDIIDSLIYPNKLLQHGHRSLTVVAPTEAHIDGVGPSAGSFSFEVVVTLQESRFTPGGLGHSNCRLSCLPSVLPSWKVLRSRLSRSMFSWVCYWGMVPCVHPDFSARHWWSWKDWFDVCLELTL